MNQGNIASSAQEILGRPAWHDLYPEDRRLSEVHPEAFRRYIDRFVRYFPKGSYHVKRCYAGGWPQQKVKRGSRQGKPMPLIDAGDYLHCTETVERHLDYRKWADWKYHATPATAYQPPARADQSQFWLAVNAPRFGNHDCIDIDSKLRLGYYRWHDRADEPLRPVMLLLLEHFQKVKAIYDAFPDRIWCVSSETLGLHAWKWYGNLLPLDQRRQPVLNRLEAIGFGGTEVHPMPGRAHRRPFGQDYRTITATGVLTSWIDELDYFENPGPTPTFRRIAGVLLSAMSRQWACWLAYGEALAKGVYPKHVLAGLLPEVRRVLEWLDAGCPGTAPIAVCISPPDSRPEISLARPRRRSPKPACILDVDSVCKAGQWVQTCESWARNGLPVPDSIYPVCAELAKWLYWIELYHVPEDRRRGRVLDLLKRFVAVKHNGMCDRILNGDTRSVHAQLGRIVEEVIAHGDVKAWTDVRHKRQTGQYKHVMELACLMVAQKAAGSDGTPSSSGSVYSVSSLPTQLDGQPCASTPALDHELLLPTQVTKMIQLKAGRYKIIHFATRFLNHLYEHGGKYCVSQETLMKFLGYRNPNQACKYKKVLLKAGVISQGSYRAHAKSREYILLVKPALDQARGVVQALCS